MKKAENAFNKYRPEIHFSAPKGWINDPNGLVFDGEYYHLYYQYDPDSIVHGPMHWGHARTKDFITWEHLPIALKPDENGEIFSGSMVIDTDNTSGFGKDGAAPMVAVFTHHKDTNGKIVQSQSLAYSVDGGVTFEKYSGNPVLETGMQDFRDPKVFWHPESGSWIMPVIGGRNVMLYSSVNLKQWTHTSTFTTPNPQPGGIWECPDLIRFETREGTKWVLIVSINSGADGDFGMQYFVGSFDGKTFTAETLPEEILMLDFCYDNYAAVTYNGIKDRVVCVGWMNSWYYGTKIPAEGFRGTMCFPRELDLVKTEKGYRLKQKPVRELEDRLSPCEGLTDGARAVKIELGSTAQDSSICLKNDKEELSVKINAADKSITMDRRNCGHEELGEFFLKPQTAYYDNSCKELFLLLDTSSIELFVNGGELCGTMQYFIDSPFTKIEASSNIKDIKFYSINSVDNGY